MKKTQLLIHLQYTHTHTQKFKNSASNQWQDDKTRMDLNRPNVGLEAIVLSLWRCERVRRWQFKEFGWEDLNVTGETRGLPWAEVSAHKEEGGWDWAEGHRGKAKPKCGLPVWPTGTSEITNERASASSVAYTLVQVKTGWKSSPECTPYLGDKEAGALSG